MKETKTINGKECIEHRIKISEFVSSVIYIPEEMTSSEFRGLMSMSNQLIKISQNDDENGEIKRTRQKHFFWSDEQMEILKKNAGKCDIHELAKLLNIEDEMKIRWKARDLGLLIKKINHIGNTPSGLPSSNDERKKIINIYSTCYTPQLKEELAFKYNVTKDFLQKAISYWRKKGL